MNRRIGIADLEAGDRRRHVECRAGDRNHARRDGYRSHSAPAAARAVSIPMAGSLTGAVSLVIVSPRLKASSYQFPQVGTWRAQAQQSAAAPASVGIRAGRSASTDRRARRHRGQQPEPASSRPATSSSSKTGCTTCCSRRWKRCSATARWRFPFQPFPYQFEGVAFLYPRYAAILADEMGLGKTMQAITAIRLLLHAGRSAQRAAGLPQAAGDQLAARVRRCGRRKMPLTVIEGDQATPALAVAA